MTRTLIVALALALTGCNREPVPPTLPPADIAPFVAGNSDFALDLYARLARQPGNLAFSPYSVSAAFAMTSAGARGQTADEMSKVFHFPTDLTQLHPAFASIDSQLRAVKGVELRSANALWGQKDFGFLPEFVALTKRHYGTGLREVDFGNSAAARETINSWVKHQTKDAIPSLVGPDDLTPNSSLVLTNAVYFKGNWASRFEKDRTGEQSFYLEPGKPVRTPMMSQSSEFPYAEDGDLQIAEFPYQGNAVSMVVVVPLKADGLAAVESGLTPAKLDAYAKAVKPTRINVYLPKFRATHELRLKDTLAEMGMPTAFSQTADFSGMAGPDPMKSLFVGAVVHKSFLEISEEGTDAAGATAVVVEKKSDPEPGERVKTHPTFNANRPFLFLVRDNATNSILFLGRVQDPRNDPRAPVVPEVLPTPKS